MSDQLSLSARYDRALSAASVLSAHSALTPEYKQISNEALTDLRLVAAAISDLQLFSKNETLEDVSTRQLVYLSVPFAIAELLQSLPSTEPSLRKDTLAQAEALRSRSLSTDIDEPANNYEALRALLTSSSNSHAGSVNTGEDDDMDDETLRELSILLLRLLFTQANASLLQLSQELQLLQNMPLALPPTQNAESSQPKDDTWRLDPTPRGGPNGKGPLMDAKGRPQRPFTIMPAGHTAERTRLQQEVFQPDHRLPTMTIDEYLAEEERRGNVIRGGGKASEEAPTSSEQLAIDAEQDGTRSGEEKSEEKRLKDETWAVYTDDNPKGLGNTMNRG
ncbi:hypothetical protein FRC09_001073 [Ceratobasidium sp. 395]|nr:hypothetical protein FRC09_001073 [Ceratobasidium sp. 395]